MKHTLPHLSLMLVPLAAALVATGAAHAAPAVGPGDMSFYDAPAPTARAGELLSYRPTTLNLGRNAPGHGAWNVKYQSTNSKGAPNIVTGTVRRRERNDLFIDLGKAEAVMPGKEQVPGEEYAPGERIRCLLMEIQSTPRGPEIILSRASPKFVRRLFELEVTEVADGTVKIEAFAREFEAQAGKRT